MNKPNNVIDLKSRRQNGGKPSRGAKSGQSTPAANSESVRASVSAATPVLDMTERRNEMLTHERRKVRRTILTEFIGAFVVIPDRGLQRVTIYDISEDGIAFDLDLDHGGFRMGEEVAVRVYLNNETYFPFITKIANVRAIPAEGVTRHGGGFAKGTVNDEALHHFVKFIETVSASLQTDQGDIMVSNLRR